jgi:hypothetical protein
MRPALHASRGDRGRSWVRRGGSRRDCRSKARVARLSHQRDLLALEPAHDVRRHLRIERGKLAADGVQPSDGVPVNVLVVTDHSLFGDSAQHRRADGDRGDPLDRGRGAARRMHRRWPHRRLGSACGYSGGQRSRPARYSGSFPKLSPGDRGGRELPRGGGSFVSAHGAHSSRSEMRRAWTAPSNGVPATTPARLI